MEGFLSVDALHLYMEERIRHDSSEEDSSPTNRPEAIPDQLSYVFPSLQFSQNGLLEKWLFAAELNVSTLENISIEFEVWRKVGIGMTANTTTITASPVRTGYLNVYEYTVTPPQPVLAGDYAGVRVLLPSLLRPLWVQNSGTLYQRVVKPADGEVTQSFSFSGRAVPLFVAQVKGEYFMFEANICYELLLPPYSTPSASEHCSCVQHKFYYFYNDAQSSTDYNVSHTTNTAHISYYYGTTFYCYRCSTTNSFSDPFQ